MSRLVLQGDGIPRSPNGRATYRMEAHHYVGWVTYVVADAPEVVADYLPPELTLGEDPILFVKAYSLRRRRLDQDYGPPEFSQYLEVCLSTVALHQGVPGHYNLGMWLSHDWATWKAREVLGWPKKLATIFLSLDPGAPDPSQDPATGKVECRVSRYGHPVLDLTVDLRRPVPLDLPPFGGSYAERRIPSPEAGRPGFRELIRIETQQARRGEVRTGAAQLTLYDGPDEELAHLQPSRIRGGACYATSWVLPAYPGKVLVHEPLPAGP